MYDYSNDIVGNVLVLDGSIQQLTDLKTAVSSVLIRNNTANAIVYIYSAGGVPCYFLNAEETISIAIRQPSKIKVQGTDGQQIYWLANALQLR